MFENQKFDGSLLAARYAFMPNKLRYCGPDSNSELFAYTAANQSDAGLQAMLKEFETMFPYLRLIAEANHIADPFNYKVVEAYWIGNELLENVTMQNFYRYLVDEQKLKKKFKPAVLEKVFGKIPVGAKPHHSFHVFNIPKRTGHYPVEHSLVTMDSCRITPAKIKALASGSKPIAQSSKLSGMMAVEYQPLVLLGDRLELGEMVEKEVLCEMNDKAFVKQPKVGDWVSLHWSWVCDFLTKDQVDNLQKWTKYNLALTNLNL
ncbi:MAG: DUF6390 family protein [Patescibacteria group bacterium]|jgi:hypothetical protein